MNPDPLVVVAQLVFGFVVKKWPVLAAWPNKLIPIFNFILAILIGLAGGVAHSADFGSFFSHGFGKVLVNAAFNTILSTGTHSFGKNFLQQVKKA